MLLEQVLSKEQRRRLEMFLDLLEKWNRRYNLTAIRDRRQMVTHHVLDSLSVLGFISAGRLLDVGTGAGFPGVPIALAKPDLECVLLDSNHKKTRFLTQVKAEIGLDNVEIVTSRAEAYQAAPFDQIITRAVGSMLDSIEKTQHLLAPKGKWLFMKGQSPDEEIQELGDYSVVVEKLSIEGLDAERRLVLVGR